MSAEYIFDFSKARRVLFPSMTEFCNKNRLTKPETETTPQEQFDLLTKLTKVLHSRMVGVDDASLTRRPNSKEKLGLYADHEFWTIYTKHLEDHEYLVGDCDDFAMYARFCLRDMGYNMARLLKCYVPYEGRGGYGGHLAVEYRGWIIDSYTKVCNNRFHLDWYWHSVSSYNNGGPWHRILPGV